MRYPERATIVDGLPYASKLGYMAYCLERNLLEARLHPAAAHELATLPYLTDGLQVLWDRAERGVEPDTRMLDELLVHLDTYESPGDDAALVVYHHDISLVMAARMLRKAIALLQRPDQTGRFVAGALEGPAQAVGLIYADVQAARRAEQNIADAALVRLQAWGPRPFDRKVLQDIPEWPRGPLSTRYAAGGVRSFGEGDED